jgi:hypothetical protein
MGRKVKPSEHGEGYGTGKILEYYCLLLEWLTSENVEACDSSKVRCDHV